LRLHRFLPGLADKPRFFRRGNPTEPGHRMMVRVHLDGRWLDAAYNRETCRFWIKLDRGEWLEVKRRVVFWSQRSPYGRDRDPDIHPELLAWERL